MSKVRNKPTNRSYCHKTFFVTSSCFGCTHSHSLMLSSHPLARGSSGTCSGPLSCSCPCLHSDPASHLALSPSQSLALSLSRPLSRRVSLLSSYDRDRRGCIDRSRFSARIKNRSRTPPGSGNASSSRARKRPLWAPPADFSFSCASFVLLLLLLLFWLRHSLSRGVLER